MKNDFKLIGPISQLVTLSGLPVKGRIAGKLIEPIGKAAVLCKGDKIYKAGSFDKLKQEAAELNASFIHLDKDYVCLPGFIDAHTHICFAGLRANDYALRNEGKSYIEIAEAGGGIWDSVKQTRKASMEELAGLTAERANRHLKEGVTTIEVKSGYGLSVTEELKILKAIQFAGAGTKADLISTCLAAHTFPADFHGTCEEYLTEIAVTLLPVLLTERLTNRVDAFVEKSGFSAHDIAPYFKKAIQYGFTITVHADQFTAGGSAVAIEFGAVSADHLEASTQKEIQLLAGSNVIPVALPGASVGLGCSFAPARKLLDAGASLAIASDWNPGSAPMGDLLTLASILGTFEKLSHAEVFAGLTYRAANALGLFDRGRIDPGLLADFILFPVNDYKEILYNQGKLKPEQTWKKGERVF